MHLLKKEKQMLARRQFLKCGAGSLASLLCSRAFALDYPARPVRWVVTTAAGGTADVVSRLIGQSLSTRLGQSFVIDNRPGASGNIATASVVKSPADGYTLLIISKNNVIGGSLSEHLNFEFQRDIRPVAGIMRGPLVMLVNPTVPANSIPEFIAYAKANLGAINYGTPGIGSDPHLASELFKKMTGIDMGHVPYRGGLLALTDLLANHVQLMFSNLPSIDYIKSGKLRALGVTTAEPSKNYPNLPAIAEFVPGFDISVWFCLGVRTGTPADIIDLLSREVGAALAEPKVEMEMATLGGSPMLLSPTEADKFLKGETNKWTQVVRAANIGPD
jgi:tripartite-type tricarboxylate transporter receptor subunit TctC